MSEVPSIAASDLSALPALLTVAEVAEVLRVGRSWVYEHAAELGAVKLGSGQSAPLRIPRDGVREMLVWPLRRPCDDPWGRGGCVRQLPHRGSCARALVSSSLVTCPDSPAARSASMPTSRAS